MSTALELLATVIDPELQLNIVEMGLVYDCAIKDKVLYVLMTLTTPVCPFRDILEEQLESIAESMGCELDLQYTFDPPWNPNAISKEALLKKGLL